MNAKCYDEREVGGVVRKFGEFLLKQIPVPRRDGELGKLLADYSAGCWAGAVPA
jgi:hypothetical protein